MNGEFHLRYMENNSNNDTILKCICGVEKNPQIYGKRVSFSRLVENREIFNNKKRRNAEE